MVTQSFSAICTGRSVTTVTSLTRANPGYIVTGINQDFFASDKGKAYVASLFPGRPGNLEELDGALLLLAGAGGSYIQGVTIPVDGGTLLGSL